MNNENIKRTTLSIPQKSMDNISKPANYGKKDSANEVERKNPNFIRDYSPFNEFLTSQNPIGVTLINGNKHEGHLMRILPHGWIEISKILRGSDEIHYDLGKLVFKAKEVTHIEEIKEGIRNER